MDDFKNISDSLETSIKKLHAQSKKILSEIQSKEPDKVAQILQDQKATIEAIQKGDFSAITKLQEKYADNSN